MTRPGPPRRSVALLAVLLLLSAVSPALAERADVVRKESFVLLNEGITSYKRGDYGTAVEKLDRVAQMALNSFRAYYYLGLALIGDRRHEDAVEALAVALDLDPTHLRAHVAHGDAFLKLGDTGEASASYFRALKLRPEFPPALDGLARVHDSRAEEEKAIEFFSRAIRSNRGFADAYTHLGDIYLRNGRFEQAVRLLAEAVTIRPDFAPGLNRLAQAYAQLGLTNEAVATIRKAVELEPGSASHRAALGHIQLSLGLDQNARESFDEAVELDPALPEARRGLAELARRDGDYEQALGQLDIALDDPRIDSIESRTLREYRAELETESTRLAELTALDDSGEATAEDYRELAGIYTVRRRWDDAIEFQMNAPATPEDKDILGYLLFEAGRYRDANAIYSELAASLGRASDQVNRGVTLALLGDHAEALAAYQRAVELDDASAEARLFMGNALMRLGRKDEAVQAYLAYLDAGGRGANRERVIRILQRIAPESAPAPTDLPIDTQPPPLPPEEDEGEEATS
jgi:tetratricopeptide (TPR) repeat protein